jgi:ATP-binding cassette subfamily B protein
MKKPGNKAKVSRVLRFVTHYWLLSPKLFAALLGIRIASTLVDVSIPIASGWLVDAIASGAPSNPWPAIHALAIFVALGALFHATRFRKCSGSRRIGTPTPSRARPCARSRAA